MEDPVWERELERRIRVYERWRKAATGRVV